MLKLDNTGEFVSIPENGPIKPLGVRAIKGRW